MDDIPRASSVYYVSNGHGSYDYQMPASFKQKSRSLPVREGYRYYVRDDSRRYRQHDDYIPSSPRHKSKSYHVRDEGRRHRQHDYHIPSSSKQKLYKDTVVIHNHRGKGKVDGWRTTVDDWSDSSDSEHSNDIDSDNDTVYTPQSSESDRHGHGYRRKHRRGLSYRSHGSVKRGLREHGRRSSARDDPPVVVVKKEIIGGIPREAISSVLQRNSTREAERPPLISRVYVIDTLESQGNHDTRRDSGLGPSRRLYEDVPRRVEYAYRSERTLGLDRERGLEREILLDRGRRDRERRAWDHGTRDCWDPQDLDREVEALRRLEVQDKYYGQPGRLAQDFEARIRPASRLWPY